MNTENHIDSPHSTSEAEDRKAARGGSLGGIAAAAAAIGLSIAGLAGAFPLAFVSIATICAGAALVLVGLAVMKRFSVLLSINRNPADVIDLESGIVADFLGGATGIVLGALGVAGFSPVILCAVAAIAMGVTLMIASLLLYRLSFLALSFSGEIPPEHEAAGELAKMIVFIQVLAGLAAITLGIIALAGAASLALTLVAILSTGASQTLSGSILAGRILPSLP